MSATQPLRAAWAGWGRALPLPDADRLALVRPASGPHGDARRGATVALGFALFLTAARLIDVSEDGKAMLAFAFVFFPALAGAALLRPVWFLLFVVAYLPFSESYALTLGGMPGANMRNLILLLAPVAWLSGRQRRGRPLRLGWLEFIVVLYVLVASVGLVSAMGQVGLGELAQGYRGWLAPILYFFIARGLVRDRGDVDAVLRLIAWVTILVAGLTWVEGIQRSDRGSIDAARVGGLMQQANLMGAFLVYYGVVLLAIGLRERRLPGRLLYLAGFLVAARAMLFTFSRAAYLALGLGSTAVALLYSPLLLVAGAAGGTAAVVAQPSLIPNSVRERFEQTDEGAGLEGETATLDKSSAYRLILWQAAFRMIRDHPLTGVGMGRFHANVGNYTSVTLSREDPNDAHNAYILIAAENGVPALLLVLLLLTTLGVTALRIYWRSQARVDRTLALAFMGTLVGVLVSCMLGSRFGDECLIGYFWVLAALLAVTRRLPPPAPAASAPA